MLRHFFSVKIGYFWTFILEVKPLPAKEPLAYIVIPLYTVGFEILSRL